MRMTLSNWAVAVTAIAIGVRLGPPRRGPGSPRAARCQRPALWAGQPGAPSCRTLPAPAAQAAAVRYWTPARMAAALRAAGGPATGEPHSTAGQEATAREAAGRPADALA